jgi:hypothetical protein
MIEGSLQEIGADLIASTYDVDINAADEVASCFLNAKTDSLGKGDITYFPDVEFVEDDNNEDDE